MVEKMVTWEEFAREASRFGFSHIPGIEWRKNNPHLHQGDFIAAVKNEETGEETHFFLKTIHIQQYSLRYSAHQDIKSGRELLISNFPLPDINEFLHPKREKRARA